MIRLGKVIGAPIIIENNLLIYAGAYSLFTLFRSGPAAAWLTLLAITAVAGCVLLHEIGHCLAGKHYGVRPIDIRLNFFGGIASQNSYDWYKLMDQPKRAIVVWFCGPLVNIILFGLLTLAMFALHPYPTLVGYLGWLRFFNAGMAVFNLMPFYPMDGGGIFYSVLRFWTTKRTAIRVASIVGMVGAVALLLLAIKFRAVIAGFIAVMIFLAAKNAPKTLLFR